MAEYDAEVVVVGGGPTGLFLACELGLAGVDTVVLERDLDRGRQTKALNLQPRSAEVLQWRGLLDAMGESMYPPLPGGHYAGLLLDYSVLDTRFPYQIGIVQADVERALEAALARHGVEVRRGHTLVGLESGLDAADDRVTAVVAAEGGEYRCTARYLVGSDGGRSTVRRATGVDFPGTEGRMPAVVCDITLARKPDGVAEEWALPVFDPTRPDFTFLLPLRNGVYRLVFGGEYLRDVDRDTPVTAADVQKALIDAFGPEIEVGEVRSGSRFIDAARQVSAYRTGRVFLAGDAAHIHAPLGGQGMNLGLQDAFNLGWKLAAAVQGWAAPDLLDSYHRERHPVAAAVLENTRAQGVLTWKDPDVLALRGAVGEMLAIPETNRMLSEKISGLAVRYDLGPGAGHRMPDLDLGDGTRVADLARDGRGLLLDATPGHRFASIAADWGRRVRYHATDTAHLSAAAILVRPDGYVCATGDDAERMTAALTAWFGPRAAASVPEN
ncbi:FAD-dependent monooxygenase [Nocardia terpenica]|uniref:FAD-binding domain-containing protein n=1 Tax=Nocardia terpenica TaxID=455432 RepID=A0A164LGC0_9NOCA|nr:FAD-dependent monooxygenase [Nocardia terpenica]KZM72381.1 hypothetical protein AWN90_26525 [Nocardia terpenica]MBF6059639.1 FAD-dependent monooxygenase [Nocardia terpenica]MBF6102820.1 FAD-dependent monooxygenase [Nocardia terpenica]MBF6110989.1 FAD-dependent monooxygenase [Nocardia terpenica]MBF6117120.1 FAD-dependent monooxygenase [Nocardia terpenica]